MSKLALDDLVNSIQASIEADRGKIADEQAVKIFRGKVLNYKMQSISLSANQFGDETVSQFNFQLKRKGKKLDDAQIRNIKFLAGMTFPKIKKVITEGIPKGVPDRLDSKKGIDYIEDGRSIIIRAYGEGDNFTKIYNFLYKPGAGFSKVRPILNEYLTKVNEIARTTDVKQLFQQGHASGSNVQYFIADKLAASMSVIEAQGYDPVEIYEGITGALAVANLGDYPGADEPHKFFIDAASQFIGDATGDASKRFNVGLIWEAAGPNQAKNDDRGVREAFVAGIRKYVNSQSAEHWVTHEGSDSQARRISKVITQEAIKAGFKTDEKGNIRLDTKPAKTQKTIVKKVKTRVAKAKASLQVSGKPGRQRPEATRSYLSLAALINRRLPPKVRQNMGTPGLVNRTGRFSNSARVVGITETAQGFPSIAFTYERDPYDVFDRTVGRVPWKTPPRDPRALVEKSVRELATELGMTRFYTRRAQ